MPDSLHYYSWRMWDRERPGRWSKTHLLASFDDTVTLCGRKIPQGVFDYDRSEAGELCEKCRRKRNAEPVCTHRKIGPGLYEYRGEEIEQNVGVPASKYGRWVWNNNPYTYLWQAEMAINDYKRNQAERTG